MRVRPAALAAAAVAVMTVVAGAPAAQPTEAPPSCGPAGAPLVMTGTVTEGDARTYQVKPFTVPPGVGRVEVAYSWSDDQPIPSTPLTATTLDLGLWDEDGYRSADGFRGWSGSRQAKIFVQDNAATRGYRPGAIRSGTWWVELGIAAVAPGGASWKVEVVCTDARDEPTRPRTPFPRGHVARDGPGWYHGDFHMHGYHSHARGPDWDELIAQATAAGLDFLPITEYVTDAHWAELGLVQRQHKDVLVWPGREIITYFGHANSLGITPGVIEYRHGFKDVKEKISLGDIQDAVKAAGGLFQVSHPTFFPGPVFRNLCRGCEFELEHEIDWDQVDTIEVVTGPPILDGSDAGGPPTSPLEIENPFIETALDLWERKLREGYRIAPVSASDSKGVESSEEERHRKGYGSSATAVRARNLSIAALHEAIAAGDVYVRVRGAHESPELDVQLIGDDGQRATFGGSLPVDRAMLEVTVRGGDGQLLRIIGNGDTVLTLPVVGDEAVIAVPVTRLPATEGPLGTFWRVETLDHRSRTAIGNAVFLRGG